MLQIITGRFFKSDNLYRTRQDTVLYSNYDSMAPIETLVGSYTPAGAAGDMQAGVYSVEQRLEASGADGTPFVLVAVSPEYLAHDFAVVMSFCLEVTCALDSDLVARLTQSKRPPIGVPSRPAALVPKVFERELHPPDVDAALLPRFLAEVVQLERRRYMAAMKAMRRYIVGLHRVGDDLPLAYTMLVASVESLAQQFDEFSPSWDDFDERKRGAIDRALTGATSKVRRAVRAAVLDIEHVALARRYREFVMANLPPSFYREEAAGRSGSVRANELPDALARAYSIRSRLIHQLEDLPRQLVYSPPQLDIVEVDGKPTLTFRGLARVARRIILNFVATSPRLTTEEYHYRGELPGVMSIRMAPRYWIGRAENYHTRSSRRYLGGFLSELESVLQGHQEGLTDLTPVLKTIEAKVPTIAVNNRLPMLALYVLYHRHIAQAHHRPGAEAFFTKHATSLDAPSIESLICHLVLNTPTGWDPQVQLAQQNAYFKQRFRSEGLKIGSMFETALIVHTAAAFRSIGDLEMVSTLASEVVTSAPGSAVLLEWEMRLTAGEDVSFDWEKLLLPRPASPTPRKPSRSRKKAKKAQKRGRKPRA